MNDQNHMYVRLGLLILSFWAALLCCYIGLSSKINAIGVEILKIQTVMIIKRIPPSELFTAEGEK